MKRTAEVVIVGGGVMGASTAYHLATRGCTDVVLLEREDELGLGSTGKNAGGIRHQFSSEQNIELSRHSIAMLERFPEEMEQEIDLNFCGYLFLLDDEDHVATFRKNVALQNAHGVPSRMIAPDEIAERVPQLVLDGVLAGTFHERDGLADPHGVLYGYARQARRLGVAVELGVEVIGIDVAGGAVRGVRTQSGTIAAPMVVIATGPWSAAVGRMAGVELPVQPVRRQIAVTRPIAGVDRSFPFTIDFSKSLYFHYESGGLLTGMSNADQAPGFDVSVDEDWRLVHFEEAVRRVPALADAELLTEWAGLYEVTPDHQPILGRLPHAEGLVACTGFSGHGFMHGPVCGLLMAEEILDGRAHTIDIDALRAARFASGGDCRELAVV